MDTHLPQADPRRAGASPGTDGVLSRGDPGVLAPPRLNCCGPASCTVPELQAWASREFASRAFLEEPRRGIVLTHGQAQRAVSVLAARLQRWGVQPGDRVAVLAENRVEVALLVLAIARLGAVFCVLGDALRPETAAEILRQAAPRLVFASTAFPYDAASLTEALVLEIDAAATVPDGEEETAVGYKGIDADPVGLAFTSGSTGLPRGVVLTHDNILFSATAIQRRLEYRCGDRIGLFVPLSFDYGLYQIFLAALSGATLVLYTADAVAVDFLRTLAAGRVTVLPAVPTILSAMVGLLSRQRGDGLPALRSITSTGDYLAPAHAERLRAALPGVALYPMYGLTECKRVTILTPDEAAAHPGSVGRPLDGTEVRVVDRQGSAVAPGEVGEMVVRGRTVTAGYWRSPRETRRRFRTDSDTGGRSLYTGDLCRIDEQGYVYVIGRRDALVKHRGHRVSCLEVEGAAVAVPGVLEAGVVRPRERDELHLFLRVGCEGTTSAVVLGALAARLEPFKLPDYAHVLGALPHTRHGKVDRAVLRGLVDRGGDT